MRFESERKTKIRPEQVSEKDEDRPTDQATGNFPKPIDSSDEVAAASCSNDLVQGVVHSAAANFRWKSPGDKQWIPSRAQPARMSRASWMKCRRLSS